MPLLRSHAHPRAACPSAWQWQHSPPLLLCGYPAHSSIPSLQIDFPIIADPTREVSVKYGMLDPNIKVPNQLIT